MTSHGNSLYDQFLEKLPSKDEETSPPFSCIKDIFHGKDTAPGSSEHPVVSAVGKPDSSLIETEEFLKKIYEPVDLNKVHGFDYDKMSMKMLLLNDKIQASDVNLVGIFGMLGVGKTTLGRLICNEEEVKQRFVPRISITMHETESMETVVENMLQHLEVDKETIDFISNEYKEHKLPGLLYALYLQLKGKRYLILLDDVRDNANYYKDLISCLKQGHGFPKGCGGAVILTSRNEEAIKTVVEEKKLHHLLPLSDPTNCWQIYQNLALFEDTALDPQSTVKDELKKKCGGLPLAARILGELKHRESQNEGSNQESKSGNEDGSKEAPTGSEVAAKQGSKNSGDGGSKETSTTPNAKEASEAPNDDASQAPTASNEADKQTSD